MNGDGPAQLYLALLKRCLNGSVYGSQQAQLPPRIRNPILRKAFNALHKAGYRVTRPQPVPREVYEIGRGWPEGFLPLGETMIGMARLDNVQQCVEDALANGVEGDLIEAGVWRGGTTIFMRGILKAHDVHDRRVVVADSFAGLPAPDAEKYPADEGVDLSGIASLAVPVKNVRAHFHRYSLLDDQVEFVEGWFRDTLPALSDRKWAVIRLDGDLYESTMDGLERLYPNLSVGGYLIMDDYGGYKSCREAVHDYRNKHGIEEPIQQVDWTGAYWRRER